MLGRHGGNLFWMARYLERSENNARRIQAVLHYALTRKDEGMEEWLSIANTANLQGAFGEINTSYSIDHVINYVLRDKDNANSVISLMTKARQNGRSVRTALTQEVWQSLNESWMACDAALRRQVNIRDLPIILENIVKGSSVFRGALYGTMLHNDIFNFLRLGTYIERADNTARLINLKYHRLLPTAAVIGGGVDQSQWEVLLRSLAAWRSYNWLGKGRLNPIGVADFLIFDERMPRSLCFCYKEIQSNLSDLEAAYARQYPSGRLSNKMCQGLIEGKQNELHRQDLRDFIGQQIMLNNSLSETLHDDFNLI